MMDFGCHRLEVLTNLFGKVRRVESIVANVVFDREVEDTAAALLQFENGVCASVTVTHAANEPQDTLSIFGTKGSIHMPVLNQPEIRIKIGRDERTEFYPTAANTHQPLIEDFAEAVLQNREPLLSGEIGKSIALLEEEIYKNS
jgi:predicted dehydrogenase